MERCEACSSSLDLLRCVQCQNCYCQVHQLSHWQKHQVELDQRVDAIPGVWDGESEGSTVGARPSAAAASPSYPPAGRSPENLQQQFHPGHNLPLSAQGRLAHPWSSVPDPNADISGYANDWGALGGPMMDAGQFANQAGSVLRSHAMSTAADRNLWMRTMCDFVIRDMDRYGICVIDNFAGQALGSAVLEEVVALYAGGQFVDGQVMSTPGGNATNSVRGDKIVWVNGQEPSCKSIGNLIRLVDSIVMTCNKMRNNGKLGQYNLSDRSRAMVACYPGSGTQYVKHVDNPNRDGRCITCIYYLNKDWDVKRDGGLLRIFPNGQAMSVADIDPTFDRILLFWSDRRNPHEVQPSLRTRYAITLWYYDKEEAAAARRRQQETRQMRASNGASAVPSY